MVTVTEMEAILSPVMWISMCIGHSCCCCPGHLTCHQQWPTLSPQYGTLPRRDQAVIFWQISFTWPLPSWKGEQIDTWSEKGLACLTNELYQHLGTGVHGTLSGDMAPTQCGIWPRAQCHSGGGTRMGCRPSNLLAWVGFSWTFSAVWDFLWPNSPFLLHSLSDVRTPTRWESSFCLL